MHLAASLDDLRTSSKAVSTGERRGNPTQEHHVQKNQSQQGGQKSQQTPSGGSSQQNQSGGSRTQQGGDMKSDSGQAQSRSTPQQGNDPGSRSDKQR
jgi:hypothetical protein